MQPGQHIVFLSDFHLGVPNREDSLVRERRIVKFLDEAARTVCDRLATAESTAVEDAPEQPSERILFRHAQPTDTWTSCPAASGSGSTLRRA